MGWQASLEERASRFLRSPATRSGAGLPGRTDFVLLRRKRTSTTRVPANTPFLAVEHYVPRQQWLGKDQKILTLRFAVPGVAIKTGQEEFGLRFRLISEAGEAT